MHWTTTVRLVSYTLLYWVVNMSMWSFSYPAVDSGVICLSLNLSILFCLSSIFFCICCLIFILIR